MLVGDAPATVGDSFGAQVPWFVILPSLYAMLAMTSLVGQAPILERTGGRNTAVLRVGVFALVLTLGSVAGLLGGGEPDGYTALCVVRNVAILVGFGGALSYRFSPQAAMSAVLVFTAMCMAVGMNAGVVQVWALLIARADSVTAGALAALAVLVGLVAAARTL